MIAINDRSAVIQLFNDKYPKCPNRQICKSILKTIRRFQENDSVKIAQGHRRPSSTTNVEKQLDVLRLLRISIRIC